MQHAAHMNGTDGSSSIQIPKPQPGLGGGQPVSSSNPGNPSTLGRAVLSALAGSKEGVPSSIWGDTSAVLLKFAGAKSFRAFFGSARSVSIDVTGDRVTFRPYRNLGSRDGYRPIKGKDRTKSGQRPRAWSCVLSAFQDTQ